MSSSEPVHTGAAVWPDLPFAAWRDTAATLHMWTQIVGKTRLALAAPQNHWWHTTLYVTERGLATSAMHCDDRMLSVEFDFIAHALNLRTSDGDRHSLALVPQSVADFHARYLAALGSLGIVPALMGRPVEVETAIPFAEDVQHAAYDAGAVRRWWQVLVLVDRVFQRFRGDFAGKQSPVHFFWGSFDLAVTRFSGRRAPLHPGGAPNCPDYVMHEAYSHECSSAGFWPGGGPVDEPAFYAYAYPEPQGYAEHAIAPAAAYYHPKAREFILPYEAVRRAADPEAELLAFLRASYEAAASLGGWDRGVLEPGPA